MQLIWKGYQDSKPAAAPSRKTFSRVQAEVWGNFARRVEATVRAPELVSAHDAECARIAGQLAACEDRDLAHMRSCVADKSEQW